MSIYQLNKILYMSDNDPAFRKRMAEPESAIASFDLTEEERTALLEGAVGSRERWASTPFCSTTCPDTSYAA